MEELCQAQAKLMINWHNQVVCGVKELSVLNWQLREGFKESGPVDGSFESALEDGDFKMNLENQLVCFLGWQDANRTECKILH